MSLWLYSEVKGFERSPPSGEIVTNPVYGCPPVPLLLRMRHSASPRASFEAQKDGLEGLPIGPCPLIHQGCRRPKASSTYPPLTELRKPMARAVSCPEV